MDKNSGLSFAQKPDFNTFIKAENEKLYFKYML